MFTKISLLSTTPKSFVYILTEISILHCIPKSVFSTECHSFLSCYLVLDCTSITWTLWKSDWLANWTLAIKPCISISSLYLYFFNFRKHFNINSFWLLMFVFFPNLQFFFFSFVNIINLSFYQNGQNEIIPQIFVAENFLHHGFIFISVFSEIHVPSIPRNSFFPARFDDKP